jgi:U3 small nucleolar RNA-associated protein 21
VAIGLKSGEIIVHNLKFDEIFVKFKQDWGPVTSLAFRSDRNDLLISGSSEISDQEGSGHVAIWDLNEKKLSGQMRDAHCGDVTGKLRRNIFILVTQPFPF